MPTDSVQEQTVPNQASDDVNANSEKAADLEADKQTANEQRVSQSLRRLSSFVVGLVVIFVVAFAGVYAFHPTDPYVQSVLAMTGDASRGREIFKLNCATCHGLEASGEVGPDLRGVSERKSKRSLIEQVISGETPPMPQFQPGERDMADLLSFLETL